MSTLGERVEGLRTWAANYRNEFSQLEPGWHILGSVLAHMDALAAALVAEEQGDAAELKAALVTHEPIAYRDHSDAWINCTCGWGSFGESGEDWANHFMEARATAPSLHKEGSGGRLREFADKLAAAIKARDFTDGWNPFSVQQSCSEMVHEVLEDEMHVPAALHKEGAGGERAISRETLEKLFDEYVPLRPMHPEAKGYMFEMLTAELNEAASPAGRAEQVLGSTGADLAGEERDRVKPK